MTGKMHCHYERLKGSEVIQIWNSAFSDNKVFHKGRRAKCITEDNDTVIIEIQLQGNQYFLKILKYRLSRLLL